MFTTHLFWKLQLLETHMYLGEHNETAITDNQVGLPGKEDSIAR